MPVKGSSLRHRLGDGKCFFIIEEMRNWICLFLSFGKIGNGKFGGIKLSHIVLGNNPEVNPTDQVPLQLPIAIQLIK